MATPLYLRYPSTSGGGVTSLNTLTGALTLTAGTGISITPSGGNTLTIASTSAGDVTLTAVGSSPNANGASLSGQALTLQPANGSFPGVLTAIAQTIGGNKTFTGTVSASNLSGTNSGDVTIGTANGLSLTGQALSLALATSSTPGAVLNIGAANGVATLDSGGKIPLTQLPASLMEYQGTWNASTNTPTLADGTGVSGYFYRVNVAGTQNLGSGAQTFVVGDWVMYNGAIWQLAHAGADAVLSVNGTTGVVTVNAINQLTGDVTTSAASGSQSLASTVAKIQGTTVSGTTGTGNVVFSASPTLTGTIVAAAANFSGAISASNFSGSSSGTNTGDGSTSVTGVLKGNGSVISAAVAGTDYSVGTSGLATGIVKSTTGTGALTIAVAGDFPTLNQNTTGTASNVTGVVALINGGTGTAAASANAAFNALSPMTTGGDLIYGGASGVGTRLANGSSGNVLTSAGGTSAPTWQAPARTINAQTGTTYTFVLADGSGAGFQPLVTLSNASPVIVTIPTNASVAFPIGTQIDCINQGVGKVTFAAAGGVTVNSKASNLSISAQYVGVTLVKTATNTWTLMGDLVA